METKNQKKELSPLEKLLDKKARVEAIIKIREKNLERDWIYIRDNSSSLIISGITSILFPSNKSKSNHKGALSLSANKNLKETEYEETLSFSDYLSIGKKFAPVVWEIAQPYLLTWGISVTKNLIGKIFSKKKNRDSLRN